MDKPKISEAQKKALEKYKSTVKRFTVDFPPTDAELYEHLRKQPNKQGYIKSLIRADMEPPSPCPICANLDELYNAVCYIPNDNGGATDIALKYCPCCGRKVE